MAAATPTAIAPERVALGELLHKKYKYLDRSWDLIFWLTAIPIVGAAADITKLLFAGDWDFWTDWKDPVWWPTVTAFAVVIIPSALQYIQWTAWRFPTGATYTSVALFLCAWIGRYFQWHIAEYYPMNFVWPISTIGAGIFMDWILLKTGSYLITSLFGAPVFAVAVWAFNYVPLAPFLQPAIFMHHVVTVADIQGVAYIRSQTPEYLRHIERGTLRSFLGEAQYVSLAFGSTLAIAGYWVGQFIGRYLAVWPIGRFIKNY